MTHSCTHFHELAHVVMGGPVDLVAGRMILAEEYEQTGSGKDYYARA